MKQLAFVVSASGREDFKISEVIVELNKRDIEVEIVAFDEDKTDSEWLKYDLIIPTSALSYTDQYQNLLKWISQLESAGAALTNPGPVIRWNSHKSYLLYLREKGIQIPRSGILKLGSTLDQVVTQMESLGCKDLVVKPMVGASGHDTSRVQLDNKTELENVVKLCKQQELLVQEFIPGILTCGEFSLIFFNGVFSHGVRKFNVTGDFRIQGQYGGKFEQIKMEKEEERVIKSFAERVLQQTPFQNLLYARVDVTLAGPQAEGHTILTTVTPVLMELELFEPALFTESNTSAAERFADAILTKIRDNSTETEEETGRI